ncbi:MAG: sugar ABC transporter permease [Cellulosilyticum sp.]|nr:sugar ABC transporter permease [Cellulosilyticum sp.]MEE1073544.1 sugar ABC transporter permease [Cellulosilyticum sp.]
MVVNEQKKVTPLIPGIASAIIWGLGQLFNKQYVKALFFFLLQMVVVIVECLTGNYFVDNFVIRSDGGFFVKGIWGLITLGTQPRKMSLVGVTEGDHSIILMIKGIIVVMVALIFVAIYIWNIRDAYKTCKLYNESNVRLSTKAYIRELWESMFHYIILLPSGILLMFLSIMPIIFSALTAFTNYTKTNMPPTHLVDWVGLDNFKNLINIPIWTKTFFGVFGWTLIWAVIATVTCFFFGLIQAVILNSKRIKFKKLWRGIYILPWAIPSMVSLLVFRTMFNGQFGPVSQLLLDLGITSERVAWFSDPTNPNLARITLLVINLWLGFPYFMALMTGIMTGISDDLYEAAKIDGATPFDEFKSITLPIVLNAASPLLIMSFASNFNNFNVIYFLTDGGPTNVNYQFAGSTDILITWVYKLTLDNQLYNMASVMSILIFILIGSISLWNLRRTKGFKED